MIRKIIAAVLLAIALALVLLAQPVSRVAADDPPEYQHYTAINPTVIEPMGAVTNEDGSTASGVYQAIYTTAQSDDGENVISLGEPMTTTTWVGSAADAKREELGIAEPDYHMPMPVWGGFHDIKQTDCDPGQDVIDVGYISWFTDAHHSQDVLHTLQEFPWVVIVNIPSDPPTINCGWTGCPYVSYGQTFFTDKSLAIHLRGWGYLPGGVIDTYECIDF